MANTRETSPAEHTPGPWTCVALDPRYETHAAYRIDAPHEYPSIADVFGRGDGCELANARLIAAAPDLLEACNYALGFVRSWEKEHRVTEQTLVRQSIEAAIASAEGKAD